MEFLVIYRCIKLPQVVAGLIGNRYTLLKLLIQFETSYYIIPNDFNLNINVKHVFPSHRYKWKPSYMVFQLSCKYYKNRYFVYFCMCQ